jgi:hypothetical protein
MKTLKAARQEELSAILDYVHDRNYDLSKIEHNARDRSLTIPIALRSIKKGERKSWFSFRARETITQGKLIIKRALGFKVTDNAKIGEGDINTIGYQGNKVVIKGSFPVDVTIDVEGFEVELVLPDDAKLA